MKTRILKNLTGSSIFLADLGDIEVPASGGTVDVTDLFYMGDLDKSVNLRSEISAGNIVVNDGSGDLSLANSLLAITTFALYDGDTRYLTTSGLNLQSVYDGPTGSGSGRQVTTDSGPIQITPSGGYSQIELVPIVSAPSVGLAAGQLCTYNGQLYIYDSDRSLWVSISRAYPTFGRQGEADGLYLRMADVQDAVVGWTCIRNAVLLGVSAREGGGCATKAFEIRKNNGTLIHAFSLTGSVYRVENLNINLSASDYLMVWVSDVDVSATSPTVVLEIGWRL